MHCCSRLFARYGLFFPCFAVEKCPIRARLEAQGCWQQARLLSRNESLNLACRKSPIPYTGKRELGTLDTEMIPFASFEKWKLSRPLRGEDSVAEERVPGQDCAVMHLVGSKSPKYWQT